MKALTIWQPWAWAIAYHEKRVENRHWSPPQSLIGCRFAIHAGKMRDNEAVGHLLANGISVSYDMAFGAIVATAVLDEVWTDALDAKLAGQSFWWSGPFGWALRDIVTLPEPIPCRGAQGLWEVPADLLAAVGV